MNLLDRLHGEVVFPRRLAVLCGHLLELLPPAGRVLDVGCGDGRLASMIQKARPALEVAGIDVLVREFTHVPVQKYDGRTLPYPDGALDAVLLVDVVHHAEDPMRLLSEVARVSSAVLVKDHLADAWLAIPRLRLMDDIGNARHGVALRYDYWPRRRWDAAFAAVGLCADSWKERLGLYPPPASWIFERGLHFMARLRRARTGSR